MELKDFVQQTLVQIIEGVKAAQGKTGKGFEGERMTGVVNPELSRPSLKGTVTRWGQTPTPVEFDVALSVSEEKTVKGKGGLMVAETGLGAEGSFAKENVAIHRIKFQVLIALPYSSSDQ